MTLFTLPLVLTLRQAQDARIVSTASAIAFGDGGRMRSTAFFRESAQAFFGKLRMSGLLRYNCILSLTKGQDERDLKLSNILEQTFFEKNQAVHTYFSKYLAQLILILVSWLTCSSISHAQKAEQINSPIAMNDVISNYALVVAYFYQKDGALKANKELYEQHNRMKEIVHREAPEAIPEVLFIKINLSDPRLESLKETYHITELPTFLLFRRMIKKNNEVYTELVSQKSGMMSLQELVNFVQSNLGNEIAQVRKAWQEFQERYVAYSLMYYRAPYAWNWYPYYGTPYPYYYGPYYFRSGYGPYYHHRYPYGIGFGAGFYID